MAEKELEKLSKRILELESGLEEKTKRYFLRLAELPKNTTESENQEEVYDEVKGEIESLKRVSSNLTKASVDILVKTDELETCFREIQLSKKSRKIIPTPPANSIIDIQEKRAKHFSQGLNFYKLFLLCVIGSFAGVIVELLWCFIVNGHFESRAGLIYGPFNLLYGVGAIILTAILFRYRNRNSIISFVGGFVIGSLVEYGCSWGQELVFGSRSWDYTNLPFNINGRVCLLYSVFWGLLGVFWIKNIYPRMADLMLKIPNKVGKILTMILVIFMVINAGVTSIAVERWSERSNGIIASNSFEQFIDNRFTDKRMGRIFVNMNFNRKDR